MRPPRLSLAASLALIGIIALGMAALVYASTGWAVVFQAGTLGLLFAAILGSFRGKNVAWWRGVALFGWGLLVLDGFQVWWIDSTIRPQGLVVSLLTRLYPVVYHSPPMEVLKGFGGGAVGRAGPPRVALFSEEHRIFQSVGLWLFRLLFALAGGFVGRALLGNRAEPNPEGA